MRPLALLWLLLFSLAAQAGAALLPPGAPLTAALADTLVRAALKRVASQAFQIAVDQPALPLGNVATWATEVSLERWRTAFAAPKCAVVALLRQRLSQEMLPGDRSRDNPGLRLNGAPATAIRGRGARSL
jgi:hypothetical protein